jgi:uncharacterized protein YdhG (YjbR/CyaY superfamily)
LKSGKVESKKFKTVNEYLATVPPGHRVLLKRLRELIKETAPQAEELISYNIPAYKYKGMLVYFASFTNHCSLFPANQEIFTKFAKELTNYKTSKGTIQFTTNKPLPDNLIRKIIKIRVNHNQEKAARKAMAKK